MPTSLATYATASQIVSLVGGSASAALSLFWLSRCVADVILRRVCREAQLWQFDEQRLISLRRRVPLFAWFEPLILGLAARVQRVPGFQHRHFRRHLNRCLTQAYGAHRFTVDEFLALTLFQAFLTMCLTYPIAAHYVAHDTSLWVTLAACPLIMVAAVHQLSVAARVRLSVIKGRLPYCVDLLALLVGAGATPLDGLTTVVKETRDSPVGEEMSVVLRQASAGQTFVASLQQLKDRLQDPEVDEVVLAVVNADRMGTPLSEILLRLADQMRLRRIQRLEKLAGQKQAMIVFPGFVMLCAALLIIVTPFALDWYYNSF